MFSHKSVREIVSDVIPQIHGSVHNNDSLYIIYVCYLKCVSTAAVFSDDPRLDPRHVLGCGIRCLSHLQNSSSLEELQWLLDGVVEAVVAASSQVRPDQPHRDHQPPAGAKVTIQSKS